MSKNSETPAEDTRTKEEKEADQAIMYLRMAIRQLASRNWRVVSSSFGTVPVAVGETKAGLVKYQSRIATISLSMNEGEDAPTPLANPNPPEALVDQSPAAEAKS